MKLLLIFLALLIYSCSSDKDKKVDLEIFKKQGEKINVFETNNVFDKEIDSKSILQINQAQLNKKWTYEHYSSNNYYDHLVYEGKFQDVFKKNIGDYINKNNDSGSLLVSENFVFFSDEKGRIYKFDINSQKIIWELKIYDSSYNDYPKNIALFLNGDVLYAADNLGFVYSIDTETGKTIWQQNYGIPFSSHLNFHKGILYVVNQNSRLYAFNPSDGQKIWSFESLSGLIKPSRSSNISLYDNKLIFSNDVGDITAIDLDQQVIIWTKNILSQNSISNNLVFKISNILIDKKDVYVSSNSGDLFNFNIETGEIKWSQKLTSIQNHISTDKYLFVLTENGFVVAFNKTNGNILWSVNLSKLSKDSKIKLDYYGLLLALNNLYATSSNGDIYKISALDGKYISHKKINSDLSRAPIIVDNKIFILNRSSELIILN
ncbi:MAG: PQQ-binding-like beta-propeller repeat protein [Candidatus Fonsibacter lacus]